MKPIDAMPWGEVEAELIEALPNDEPSDIWRYSDLLSEPDAPTVEPAPPSRRAG
jgi:hypothetical protein